ncbi:hypothetical protein AMTRI_Chr11g99510 [Amborella trichopoda]|uniref:Uncharacterized protein n=1 Tax=Amborella trichopoda TaxID=13333 RepID=W1PM53_AMBTC|nr:hypothetical protein AMTR_s00017p00247960 [Amborella trichopoda]
MTKNIDEYNGGLGDDDNGVKGLAGSPLCASMQDRTINWGSFLTNSYSAITLCMRVLIRTRMAYQFLLACGLVLVDNLLLHALNNSATLINNSAIVSLLRISGSVIFAASHKLVVYIGARMGRSLLRCPLF